MYTVMIAEDELLVRVGIASSLPWGELNARLIAEAEDGQRAWELYQENHPDVVITDIRMPKMDGLELIKRIRSDNKNCAIIVITNVDQDESLLKMRDFGISDILLKATMKLDDIRKSLEKACATIPSVQKIPRTWILP